MYQKIYFPCKNSLLSRYDFFHILKLHEIKSSDHLKKALESLDLMLDCHVSPHFQFIQAQMQLLLCPPRGRRFTKHVFILAAELQNISPTAYKMLRKSGAIALRSIKLIKNIKKFLGCKTCLLYSKKLKPQQRLVNILLNEVKLIQACILLVGMSLATLIIHSEDLADDNDSVELASHALLLK